jgi:hypothetical protein
MSTKNGSQQSWREFSGQAQNTALVGGVLTTVIVPTIGSLLVINPAYDLSLPAYLSNGSMGNYNLQFTVNCTNQFGATIQPEIVVICVNSGILTTQMGVSSTYTGILTKEMVLSAKESRSVMSSAEHERLIGGKMLNRLLSSKVHKGEKVLDSVVDRVVDRVRGKSRLSGMM